MEGPTRVFLSYAHRDGVPLARRLCHDLRTEGMNVWLDERRLKAGGVWSDDIEREIDRTDYVIALCSVASTHSLICRGEQLRALRRGKKLIPVAAINDADFPVYLEPYQYLDFQNSSKYEAALRELLGIIRQGKTAALKETYLVQEPEPPPLPVGYVERSKDLKAVGKLLLREPESGMRVVALRGIGGSGKSVLTTALLRVEAVRDVFPDGLIWITVGKNPPLFKLMQDVLVALHAPSSGRLGEGEAAASLRRLLRSRATLLILDDVWKPQHALPFRSDQAASSALLITTRVEAVTNQCGAVEYRVGDLSEAEAMKVIAARCQRNPADLPAVAKDVVRECGYLPLAVAVAGARLRNRPEATWQLVNRQLRASNLDRVGTLDEYEHNDVFRAIQVSVEDLEPPTKKRYQDIALFPEGTPVPPSVFGLIWDCDQDSVQFTLEEWVNRSLGDFDPEGCVRFHDLQIDYARCICGDIRALHQRLINAYKYRSPEGWSCGSDDGYYFDQLPFHLAEAGMQDELRDLLLDPDWLRSKLRNRDITLLLADYRFLAADPDLRFVEQALRLSANMLAKRPDLLTSQLVGRLQSVNQPAVRRLLHAARRSQRGAWIETDHQTLMPVGGALVRTLEGHADWVSAVAVTSEGKYALSASGDGTGALWDLESGEIRLIVNGHSDCLSAVAATPDQRRAVFGGYDGSLHIWDLRRGKCLHRVKAHSVPVLSVAVANDGRRAVSGSLDNTVKMWDLTKPTVIHSFTGHRGPVFAVAVTPDGKYAVSGSWDQTLILWDLVNVKSIHTFRGHSDVVAAVALAPDGNRVLSGSWDHTLKLWDRSNHESHTLTGHSGPVLAVALTADGRRAASGSWDNTVKVWDLDQNQTIRTLEGHSDSVHAVTISENGNRVLSGSSDRTLKLWDLDRPEVIHSVKGHCYPASSVATSLDGKYAVSGSGDETLWLWDCERAEVIRKMHGHLGYVRSVAITRDGKRAVSGSNDNALKCWDLARGEVICTLEGHSGHVSAVAVTSDGKYAVSGSTDNTVKLWDLDQRHLIRTLAPESGPVLGVAVAENGTRTISASRDGRLHYWDLVNGELVRKLEGHADAVAAVAMTPDGRSAVSGSWDNTVKIWNLERGDLIRTLEGHTDAVSAVAITPDGKRALSASDDSTLILWDLERFEEIAAFGGDAAITGCTISTDGKRFVAAEASGRIHFLSLKYGEKSHG